MDRLESQQHLRTESIWWGGGSVCVWGGGELPGSLMVVCVTSRTGVVSMPYMIRTDTKETIETVSINGVSILRRL